jgi:hypothetical protein
MATPARQIESRGDVGPRGRAPAGSTQDGEGEGEVCRERVPQSAIVASVNRVVFHPEAEAEFLSAARFAWADRQSTTRRSRGASVRRPLSVWALGRDGRVCPGGRASDLSPSDMRRLLRESCDPRLTPPPRAPYSQPQLDHRSQREP